MKRLIVFLFILPALCIYAQKAQDLSLVFKSLDAAIEASPTYVRLKQEKIANLKTMCKEASKPMEQYKLNQRLFEEYCSYKNDSALFYLQANIILAQTIHRKDLQGYSLSMLALQSSKVGHYEDALYTLRDVDVSQLDKTGKADYYHALSHVYGEVAYYSNLKDVKDRCYVLSGYYEGIVLSLLDPHTAKYDEIRCHNLFSNKKYDAALRACDEWDKVVADNSREYAMVAYYRFLIYNNLHEYNKATYWVARSAISDITHAVMDQGSLWSLADILSGKDIDRSYKYIRFSWACAQTFGTTLRASQISPILSKIGDEYQTELHRANSRLMVITILITILAISLLFLLYYANRQRRKLAVARAGLKVKNERITTANSLLHEANEVKAAYIGKFLSLCANYIDRMDDMRKQNIKMIKGHRIDDLYHMLRSTNLKNEELDEFYEHFDKTFLSLYPTFVKDFNALLKPECQVEVNAEGKLNTTLRIFALIRLGIDDSGKIADILHYSANTIYNYRARTKNGALKSRSDFENEVRKLGRIS